MPIAGERHAVAQALAKVVHEAHPGCAAAIANPPRGNQSGFKKQLDHRVDSHASDSDSAPMLWPLTKHRRIVTRFSTPILYAGIIAQFGNNVERLRGV